MVSLKQIDRFRIAGLRPQVVGCIIKDGKVLITFTRKHNTWGFPQGGIDNKEDPKKALYRELGEELGKKLQKSLYGKPELFHTDTITFSGTAIGSRDLKTDDGRPVLMRGKYYFFYVIKSKIDQINVNDTEFDKLVWVSNDKLHLVEGLIKDRNKKRQFIEATKKLQKYLR